MLKQTDIVVEDLGKCTYPSPLKDRKLVFTPEDKAVLAYSEKELCDYYINNNEPIPSFQMAGPRENLFFDPSFVNIGIVTCGGLCPGLNDVIRSITMTAIHQYRVNKVIGFKFGYAGLSKNPPEQPVDLTISMVDKIHYEAGTILGSSRGPQEPAEIVNTLLKHKIQILFTVGGDGTLRGASSIAEEIKKRALPISIIGVPKTIDNDLSWMMRSFGFQTAVDEARKPLMGAHTEAKGAYRGIGLVKLMGRHSGFIAAESSLATGDVNFCLVPEVPFSLEGFLKALEKRMNIKDHAVICVAEGAGQNLLETASQDTDASGNVKLQDIGPFLKQKMKDHFNKIGQPVTIKYIDPSYEIRSLPANSTDSHYCLILGQNAVHAGMAGKTDCVIGFWNQYFTNLPMSLVTGKRKSIDPEGITWQSVLATTGQPSCMEE